MVAVTEQSPAEGFDNAPLVIEQPSPVVTYETDPSVVPPLTASDTDEPYVPSSDVTVNAA